MCNSYLLFKTNKKLYLASKFQADLDKKKKQWSQTPILVNWAFFSV